MTHENIPRVYSCLSYDTWGHTLLSWGILWLLHQFTQLTTYKLSLLSSRTAMWSIQWIWLSGKMIMICRINAYQCKSMRITINTLIFIHLCHLALDHRRGKTLFLCDSQWFSLILIDSQWFSPILTNSWWFLNKCEIDSHWFLNQSEINPHWFSMILSDSKWFLMILSDSPWFSMILK